MNTFLLGVASMLWHHWRIATLRPAFEYLGDTKKLLKGFFIPMMISTVLVALGSRASEQSVSIAVLQGLTWSICYVGVLTLLFERPASSSSITAASAGAITVVNVLILIGMGVGFEIPGAVTLGLKVFLLGRTYRVFKQQAPAVQKHGYRGYSH